MRTYTCDRCGTSSPPIYSIDYRDHYGSGRGAPDWSMDLCRRCIETVRSDIAEYKERVEYNQANDKP